MIFFTESIISTPTITKAPLVAALGMSKKIGERKSDTMKKIPTVNAVTPDRPPSAIPLALSTYVVSVELPNIAPQVVPMASLIIASFTCGMLPFGSTIPVLSAKPIRVPIVSKMFIKSRENITNTVLRFRRPEKSNLQKIGVMSCGAETGSHPLGKTVTPIGIPIIVVMMIPQNKEPLTFLAMSAPLSKIAIIPRIQVGVKAPKPTRVASLLTIMFAFFRPIKAMNIPIPADMA